MIALVSLTRKHNQPQQHLELRQHAKTWGRLTQSTSLLFQVAEPTSEPWLTLHYDEWMCATPAASSHRHAVGSSHRRAFEVLKGRLA